MSNPTKILIIEDNPADIALIEVYLREARFRHQLYQATSLKEGLGQLNEQRPDLVLLDLQLHDVEGFKTVQQFRDNAPDLPVVVLTGFKNEDIGIQSVRAGAQDFLVKGDFDARSLVRTIRYSLQRFKAQYELKEKAEQLSTSERRSRLTHHIARFGRWEMDIVTYAMKWDDEIFNFFGFPPNSFSPSFSEYLKYVHVDDRLAVERFFEKAVNDGQLHSLIHRIVLDNTVVKLFQINAKVSYDEKVNRLLLLGSVQDITEQQHPPAPYSQTAPKGAKRPAAKSNNQGQKLSKTLPSFFTFNLRTPAASISNFLYLMEVTPLTEQQQQYLDGMKDALKNLNFHLDNWASITKGNDPRLTHASLLPFLRREEQKAVKRLKNTPIKLQASYSKKLPEAVLIDEQLFAQVIHNLLAVSNNFNTAEESLHIYFGAKGKREKALVLLIRTPLHSELLDIKTARQIIKADVPFEDLFAPSSLYLPLAITARIIHLLGGRINLTKTSNQKYSIQAELPMKAAPHPEGLSKAPPKYPLHILLVEDHDLHRLATQRLLTQWTENIKVTTAKNGAEAVKKSASNPFDLILMDLQMPELNGIEAAIKIRSSTAVPIIALTANESKQEYEHCRMVNMNDYLVKPFTPERLFNAILKQTTDTELDSSS